MKLSTIIGAVLIVLGVAALAYKGFNYKSEETVLQIGSVKATAETEKSVAIPSWAGIAAIVVGVLAVGHAPLTRRQGISRRALARACSRAQSGPALCRPGRYGSTQCRVIKGSRGTRHWCQSSSPANRLAGDQSPGDLAQGRNLRRQSKGRV